MSAKFVKIELTCLTCGTIKNLESLGNPKSLPVIFKKTCDICKSCESHKIDKKS